MTVFLSSSEILPPDISFSIDRISPVTARCMRRSVSVAGNIVADSNLLYVAVSAGHQVDSVYLIAENSIL